MSVSYDILLIEGEDDLEGQVTKQLDPQDIPFTLNVISRRSQLTKRLSGHLPDLIISDTDLNGFTGIEALQLVRSISPTLPFILVSGSGDGEQAADAMLAGASDYVLKSRFSRLNTAAGRELKQAAGQPAQDQPTAEILSHLRERVKEQQCLYSISSLDEQEYTIDELLFRAVDLLPGGWQYPEITEAAALYREEVYRTEGYRETEWVLSSKTCEVDGRPLVIKVAYLEEKPVCDEGPFLAEERRLIDSIVQHLALKIERIISRKKLEEKQRLLSRAYQMADIGEWEMNLVNSEIYWSSTVRELHEVDDDYEPELESVWEFMKEGSHRDAIRSAVREAIDSGKPYDLELKLVTAKGNERWIRAVGETEVREGEPLKLFGTLQDITERKEAEIRLKKTEQKLREIVEQSTNMFYRHTPDGVLTYVSPQSKEFLGYDPEETVHRWTDFVTDNPANEIGYKAVQYALDTGKTHPPYELELKNKNGSIKWVEVNEAPVAKDGEIVAIVGSLTDITDRKIYEEKLRESLERYEYASRASRDAIYDWDIEEDHIQWGERFESLFGHKPPGTTYPLDEFSKYVHPDDHPRTRKSLVRAIENPEVTHWTSEYRFERSDGTYAYVDENGFIIRNEQGEAVRMVGAVRDVTGQIEREQKLEELSLVASKTTDIVIITDEKGITTWVNSAFTELTGYSLEEIEGKKPGDLLQGPATDTETVKRISRAIAEQQPIEEVILNYSKQGDPYWLEMTIDPIFDDEGNCIRFIAIERDVTEQKKEEQWLRLLQSAISTTTESVAIIEAEPTDLPGRKVLYVNEAFTDMTGYEREEVVGRTLHFLNGEQTDEQERKRLRRSMEKWERCEAELINYTKSGEPFWVHVSMAPVADSEDSYSHWVSVGRNITGRIKRERELEESLREKETLLLEIHHRVKNNLAVVSGMMQLQAYEEVDERIRQKLFDSMMRIQTMGAIHELLYQSESFTHLNFKENIEKLVSYITETFQSGLTLDVDFHMDEIRLNINQAIPCSLIINEVVTNVLKHAFDDKDRGTLIVRSQEKNGRIVMEIKDDGKGLPHDFGKTNGRGNLGLTLIDTLSKQLEADYEYRSVEPGALFTLSFRKAEVKGIGNLHLSPDT